MSERIKCQKNKKIIYNYLTGSPKNPEDSEFNYDDEWPINDGPLSGVKLSNLFGLALSIGYANNSREKISSFKDLSNPVNFEDYLMPMIESIAIQESTKDIKILNDESKEIYAVSQEYANAGIDLLLEDYVENMDTIIDEWHSDIDDCIEDNNILEKIGNL